MTSGEAYKHLRALGTAFREFLELEEILKTAASVEETIKERQAQVAELTESLAELHASNRLTQQELSEQRTHGEQDLINLQNRMKAFEADKQKDLDALQLTIIREREDATKAQTKAVADHERRLNDLRTEEAALMRAVEKLREEAKAHREAVDRLPV